ncbi:MULTISPECIES: fibronectin type III domain-containing protein [unclassified Campylobacter]|uniref:fibronectin type III domain-containing protein n=1 Tax=unclassified Campylobacter TaxID=2593542 RepID=UPI001237A110|nr:MULTISPECIES: fibronectin type III domain-containing protein [unclassified Campylobacter]KAA6224708.1 fibronectin type III domain-containing protein [Campylobacter sp. LR185c]KAA6225706.1 fibronectin type III domain-containing protein [Campylobacter sp. LR286c]KAA6225826.1 fibronectin type III domain-containing protein [Campylobacter sp. LR196d]KAA6229679.1 fibronectin type III domain-containing protein [Campylobacter sp. LR291e]KAA6230075.1 fibronectin type III domain-containing protein [C
MKKLHLIFCSVSLTLFLSACSGVSQQFTAKEVLLNESLPKIEQLKSLSDMSNVALEWEPLYNENIKGFYIYRASEAEPTFKLVETITNKFQTHFVDTKLEPSTKYFYKMKSFNDQNHISEESDVIEIMTDVRLPAISYAQALTNLANKIKLVWRPHSDLRVNAYIIERKESDESKFKKLAQIKNRLNAEYIDDDLKPNQSFDYIIYAQSFDGVISEASAVLSATSKALPPVVEGLSASIDGSNKISLQWNESNYKDFSYYKVYATSSTFLPYTLVAKTQSNHYEDAVGGAGKSKSYKVSIVDIDGLEGPLQSEGVSGQTLGLPSAPSLISAKSTSEGISLEWSDNDDRAVEYIVKRTGGEKAAVFKGIKNKNMLDTNALPGVEYSYEVYAIDSGNLQSEASNKVKAKQ